jgi:AbrB family looped-hinge helix DNA binding protein
VETVTISSKYQVVIPRALRDHPGLRPGQKVQVIAYGNRLEVIPVRPIQAARGFLRDLDNTFEREPDRL